jgi:hypothetical protein
MLTGNLLSIGVGGIMTIAWSLARPQNFDWEITRAINARPVSSMTTIENSDGSLPIEHDQEKFKTGSGQGQSGLPVDGISTSSPTPTREQAQAEIEAQMIMSPEDEALDMPRLKKAFRFAAWAALSLTFILIIAIPLPLFFSSHGELSFTPLLLHAPRATQTDRVQSTQFKASRLT